MTRLLRHACAGWLTLGLLAGCSQEDTTAQVNPPAANTTTTYAQRWEEAAPPVETTVNVERAGQTAARVTEPTPATGFTHDAYQDSQEAVALAELALRQSQSARVHSFAQALLRDHREMTRRLEAVAGDLDLTLQSDSAMLDESEDQLSNVAGSTFDQRFAELMVEKHEKEVTLFEREARDGLQQSVSEFASDQLPKLRRHLEMARELRDALVSQLVAPGQEASSTPMRPAADQTTRPRTLRKRS